MRGILSLNIRSYICFHSTPILNICFIFRYKLPSSQFEYVRPKLTTRSQLKPNKCPVPVGLMDMAILLASSRRPGEESMFTANEEWWSKEKESRRLCNV